MKQLIKADELATMLANGQNPVIVDVRWALSQLAESGAGYDAFLAGRIPNARFVDLEKDLTAHSDDPSQGGRHPLPDPAVFQQAMRNVGISTDKLVVIYDGADCMSAARLWWLLTDAGHQDVYVLNGGFAAWQRAGHPIETGAVEPVEPTDWVINPGQRGRVDAEGVTRACATGRRVIDVRAAERFEGLSEPLDPKAGHIPGAVNLPASTLYNEDKTFKNRSEIADVAGPLSSGDVLYCGSGITASMVLLVVEDAGFEGVVIYPGSWSEWSRQGREVATGKAS